MTQPHSKIILILSILLCIILGTFSIPEIAFAEEQNVSDTQSDQRGDDFCGRVIETGNNLAAKLNERKSRFDTDHKNVDSKLMLKIKSREGKRTENRSQLDAQYGAYFEKLENSAITNSDKKAIALFKSDVLSALEARRSAVDAATAAYNQSIEHLANNRYRTIDDAMATLKATSTLALQHVKFDCQSRGDSRGARKQLAEKMNAAQAALRTSISQAGNFDDEVQSNMEIYKKAIDDASATFMKAVAAAEAKYKSR